LEGWGGKHCRISERPPTVAGVPALVSVENGTMQLKMRFRLKKIKRDTIRTGTNHEWSVFDNKSVRFKRGVHQV